MPKKTKKIIIFAVIFAVIIVVLLLAGVFQKNDGRQGDRKHNEAGQNDLPVYHSSDFGFSFQYPKNFVVASSSYDGGMPENGELISKVSLRPAETGKDEKSGFGLTITPFGEPGPLTADRIKQDLPDMIMNDLADIIIQPDVPALAFNSMDDSIGETYEIWFIYSDDLYQIISYPEFKEQLDGIIRTWKFE